MSIACKDLSVVLGGQQILDNISAEFPAALVTGLIGPNGAGKSTLLRALAGDEKPAHGSIHIDDCPIASLNLLEMAQLRAVMTQSSHVVFDFLVEEIIAFGWLGGERGKEAGVKDVVRSCGLEALLGRQFNTLSGGEQQRVQFARALLQIWAPNKDPAHRYLLLDEPTASLDVANELQVLVLARQVAALGVGVIVVLHDLNLASRFTDRLVLLSQGRVERFGEVEQVLESECLSKVYATPLRVERHQELDRLVIYS